MKIMELRKVKEILLKLPVKTKTKKWKILYSINESNLFVW